MRLSRENPALAVVGLLTLAPAGCGGDAGAAGSDGDDSNAGGGIAAGGSAVHVRSLITGASDDSHAQPDKSEDTATLGSAELVSYNGGGHDEVFTTQLNASGPVSVVPMAGASWPLPG